MGAAIRGMAGLGEPAPVSGYRMGLMSLLAAAIGSFAGLIAYVLYDLIGLFRNLAYYHESVVPFPKSGGHHRSARGLILMPVVGGPIVGSNGQVRFVENGGAYT